MPMIDTVFECQMGDPDDKTYVRYRLGRIGRDWILLIDGGESHVGALACSNRKLARYSTFELHNHKEGALVELAVKKLGDLVSNEVVVIGGIHYEKIRSRQIERIEEHCRVLLERVGEFFMEREKEGAAST